MLLRFYNIFYNDWEKVNDLCWHRTPLYSKTFYGTIKIVAMVEFKQQKMNHIWYPEFTGDLDFLQEIYDKLDTPISFKRSQEVMAMNYVDSFLLKMNRLKAFI